MPGDFQLGGGMADELDQTSDRIEFDTSIAVRNVCEQAHTFKAGQEGDCDLCGEHFSRVIEVEKNGETILSCGRCRDKHGLS